MNRAEIFIYASRLLDRAVKENFLTIEERIDTNTIDTAVEEIAWAVEDCEEIGSSDQYYHYQGMLNALNKPSIYTRVFVKSDSDRQTIIDGELVNFKKQDNVKLIVNNITRGNGDNVYQVTLHINDSQTKLGMVASDLMDLSAELRNLKN